MVGLAIRRRRMEPKRRFFLEKAPKLVRCIQNLLRSPHTQMFDNLGLSHPIG